MPRVSIAIGLAMLSLLSARVGWGVVETESTEARRPLRVEVSEGAQNVSLRIRLPADVDPGSVEILLSGSDLTIYARDAITGHRAYERHLILNSAVRETGVRAETEGRHWLRVVLPRISGPRAMSHVK
jgi:hypothetical protein